jgi:hypothetical protein
MIRNIEKISLVGTNNGTDSHRGFSDFFEDKRSESSMERKQCFCSSVFEMEIESVVNEMREILELTGGSRMEGSSSFSVTKSTEGIEVEDSVASSPGGLTISDFSVPQIIPAPSCNLRITVCDHVGLSDEFPPSPFDQLRPILEMYRFELIHICRESNALLPELGRVLSEPPMGSQTMRSMECSRQALESRSEFNAFLDLPIVTTLPKIRPMFQKQ